MTIVAEPVERMLDTYLERVADDPAFSALAGAREAADEPMPPALHRLFLHAVIERATVYPARTRGRSFDPTRVRVLPTEAARVALDVQETA